MDEFSSPEGRIWENRQEFFFWFEGLYMNTYLITFLLLGMFFTLLTILQFDGFACIYQCSKIHNSTNVFLRSEFFFNSLDLWAFCLYNLKLNRDIINSKSLCDFCRYISRMERLMRIFLMSLLRNIAIRPP